MCPEGTAEDRYKWPILMAPRFADHEDYSTSLCSFLECQIGKTKDSLKQGTARSCTQAEVSNQAIAR